MVVLLAGLQPLGNDETDATVLAEAGLHCSGVAEGEACVTCAGLFSTKRPKLCVPVWRCLREREGVGGGGGASIIAVGSDRSGLLFNGGRKTENCSPSGGIEYLKATSAQDCSAANWQ